MELNIVMLAWEKKNGFVDIQNETNVLSFIDLSLITRRWTILCVICMYVDSNTNCIERILRVPLAVRVTREIWEYVKKNSRENLRSPVSVFSSNAFLVNSILNGFVNNIKFRIQYYKYL